MQESHLAQYTKTKMEFIAPWGWLALSTIFLFLSVILFLRYPSHGSRKQPPGPPGWPVLGNMLDLGAIPHQTLYNLRSKYGPVVWLKLGSMNTLVVQSAKTANELFKNHDSIFCDRKDHDVFTAHDYHKGSLVIGRYGAYWKLIRRLCSVELFSNKRIGESVSRRQNCIYKTIKYIEDAVASSESGEVNLTHFLFLTSFNVVGNLTFSKDLLDSECKEGHEFYEAMDKFMTWAGTPNVADFFPFLRRFDPPQRIRRKMNRDVGRAMDIVSGFVKERIEEKKKGILREKMAKDFLDVLLEHVSGDHHENESSDKISFHQLIVVALGRDHEMFLAGSETTSTAMEWTMAELLRNPEAMRKVKEELDGVVGLERAVQESDIDKLPYLQAVVKESLRLHPPGPFLIPRNSLQDTNFMGYLIPKDTQVLVNAWAIRRDTDVWEDPLSFKPERFIGSNIDYKGQHFELIPFGAGRRICVGMSLAHRILHLNLASLLHHFHWQLTNNCSPDMGERMGITARKLVPLKVVPKKRALH